MFIMYIYIHVYIYIYISEGGIPLTRYLIPGCDGIWVWTGSGVSVSLSSSLSSLSSSFSNTNRIPIQYQSNTNRIPIEYQPNTNRITIEYQSNTNPIPIQYQSKYSCQTIIVYFLGPWARGQKCLQMGPKQIKGYLLTLVFGSVYNWYLIK